MPKLSFLVLIDAWLLSTILLILMVAFIYAGRRLNRSPVKAESPINSAILSALLGLLAFLLAFTFGMSGSRYDARRSHIVDEANAIGTAILRADLYPDAEREAFRKDFKQYLEARIRYYEKGDNLAEVVKARNDANVLGMQLWNRCTRLSKEASLSVASMQMTPALNAMLDMATTRFIAELSRVPDSIVIMLLVLSLAASFYVGYISAGKPLDRLMMTGFCVLTVLVIYITLDLDRPRRGVIRLSTSHQAMIELRTLVDTP